MRLRRVKGVEGYIRWLQSKGITATQNSIVGHVDPVHVSSSLHYRENHGHGVHLAPGQQGDLAVDVNDNDVSDDNWTKRVFSESTSLKLVYYKTLAMAYEKKWPLNEMFFDGLGFMEEYGHKVNHPITGHDDHLHIGFDRETF